MAYVGLCHVKDRYCITPASGTPKLMWETPVKKCYCTDFTSRQEDRKSYIRASYGRIFDAPNSVPAYRY